MKDNDREQFKIDSTLRAYLLGDLLSTEQKIVESRLSADAEYFQQMIVGEDELIDDYIEGSLTHAERKRFERYFLVTNARRQKLRFAKALARHIRRMKVAQSIYPGSLDKTLPGFLNWHNPSFKLTAAVISIAVLSGLGWYFLISGSRVEKGIAKLNLAYRSGRPLEGRLSGLGYAALISVRGDGAPAVDHLALNQADNILSSEALDYPSASSRHGLGQLYLTQHKLDLAIEQFKDALRSDPRNPELHSDLAAAFLERGKANRPSQAPEALGEALIDFGRCVEETTTAIDLRSNMLEARFNRALCYREMSLTQSAEADWHKYLELDRNSPWSGEVRYKLGAIQELKRESAKAGENLWPNLLSAMEQRNDDRVWLLVGQNYSSKGNEIESRLIDSFINANIAGRTEEAGKSLKALNKIGALSLARADDHYPGAIADFYAHTTPGQLLRLKQAHDLNTLGFERFAKSDFKKAVDAYRDANKLFKAAGADLEALLIDYRIAHCFVLQPDYEQALRILPGLQSTCSTNKYKWLHYETLALLGNIQYGQSKPSDALTTANQALELAHQLDDLNDTIGSLQQVSGFTRDLNDQTRALGYLHPALRMIDEFPVDPVGRWGVFTEAALNFSSLDMPVVGLEFHKAALQLALDMNRPLLISRSLQFLGATYQKLNRLNEGLAQIELAYQAGERLGSERNGLEIKAQASLEMANLYRGAGDYARALENYDRGSNLFEELGQDYYRYQTHQGRLQALVALKDYDGAGVEIGVITSLLEEYRKAIRTENTRNVFFAAAQEFYDLATDFAYSHTNDSRRAFDYSELGRARSLLDSIRNSNLNTTPAASELKASIEGDSWRQQAFNPLTLSEIQTRMPADTQIMVYAVLSDKLMIWLVTRDDIRVKSLNLDQKDLAAKVTRYSKLLSTLDRDRAAELQAVSGELYATLISPVESSIDTTKQLCIVADKFLHSVPFGSLASPASKRYFVQDHTFVTAPSASIFIISSEIASGKERGRNERLLTVGNPRFNPAEFPGLADLPSAGSEAAKIARYYNRPMSLIGENATPERVKRELAKADVIHLGLHSIVDVQNPLSTQLILTPDRPGSPGSAGIIRAYEIYRMKLPARLAVLAACQTATGKAYPGEGPSNVARAFIGAGVPVVVATLWSIDSSATERLMVSFHRYRKEEGMPTAEALRRAQTDMIGDGAGVYSHPYYWAPFIIIGGEAEY